MKTPREMLLEKAKNYRLKMESKKMAHTKGPWTVSVNDKDTSIEARTQTICTDVSNCDADLIAAAPEMLQVLEELRDNFDYPPAAYKIILDAINKAKGGAE